MKRFIFGFLALLCLATAAQAQCSFSVNTAVSPGYPMAGQESQTVYLNYPSSAQSIAITATPASGTAPFTYMWAIGGCNPSTTGALSAGGATYTWQPTITDACSTNGDNVYTVTVTVVDSAGCIGQATKHLNVVNPYTADGNVVLCHKVPRSTLTQILVVSPSLVPSHLGHGDILGNCTVFLGN